MKTRCLRLPLAVAATVALVAATQSAPAQEAAPRSTPLKISKTDAGKAPTPQYEVRKGNNTTRNRQWFQVVTTFETAPEWIDEATFTYYILVKSKKPEPGQASSRMFKGDVTYVNMEKGKHRSDAFLQPSTLLRYGDVERVAVQVQVGGRLVAQDGIPTGSDKQRWWEQYTPVAGLVLNHMETPFAFVNFDDYEAVKAAPAR